MSTETLALSLLALVIAAVIAWFLAPARHAALGAWSLARWPWSRRTRRSDPGREPPSARGSMRR